MNLFKILFFVILLGGCSFLQQTIRPSKQITITSNPTEAEIFSSSGIKIGETPKILTAADLKLLVNEDHLNFVIRKLGFIERQVIYSSQDLTEIKLSLSPMTNETFNLNVIQAYSKDLNLLTRDLLQIHGLIFLNKYQEALDKITIFQKKYSGVAASHTLMGSIFKSKGRSKEAREQFLRALSIDKNDETASRALINMEN
jgi:tetratricopeptide (TPR) repeat protein